MRADGRGEETKKFGGPGSQYCTGSRETNIPQPSEEALLTRTGASKVSKSKMLPPSREEAAGVGYIENRVALKSRRAARGAMRMYCLAFEKVSEPS